MSSTPMLTLTTHRKRWEMTGWLNLGQTTALGRMFDKAQFTFLNNFWAKILAETILLTTSSVK